MATISLTSTTNLPEDWKKFRCLSPDRTSRSDIDRTGLELHRETITDLLEDRVRSRPQDVAIDSYDSQISYSQLRDMVNTMAKRLWDGGIRRSHRVGMCFHLSARAIIVILANLRLGATVVPVVPLHPRSRRLRMLQEAQASIIVVEDSGMIEELAESDIPVFDISSNQFLPAPATRLPMDTRPKTEDAAFVAFTSGSTGKPKGIVQSHEAIVTMSKALARELSVDSSARVAQFHPYIFDVAIMEITMCLITGAVLCIAKKKDMMLPCLGEVEEQLTAFRVTHVTLSPTMLNTMQPEKLSTVRVMSVMGGPLGRRAVQTWTRDWGGTFFQLWGCTEATILQSITSPMKENDKPLSIGKAIEGVCRLWVVDPANIDQLLPVGKEGELIVESRALASGYINDATATEKCFLSSPNWKYGSSKGQFYRTGDLVRREPNGSIIFVGRLDDQVNYHGERIVRTETAIGSCCDFLATDYRL